MADLHRKITERLGNFNSFDWEEELSRQEQALRAVVERHAPVPCPGFPCLHLYPHLVCALCRQHPCDELRTIAQHLGIREGNDHG